MDTQRYTVELASGDVLCTVRASTPEGARRQAEGILSGSRLMMDWLAAGQLVLPAAPSPRRTARRATTTTA